MTTETPIWPDACAALVPVYNHVATVGQVIAELRALGATVFCVDDGSDDGSGVAAEAAGATVWRQTSNSGKGVALQRGFQELADLGWRQVCTVDADGQHPSSEALRLAQEARSEPEAIWVGAREMPTHSPFSSRLGRAMSNFWTRVACGFWPGDAQCGLRVYPLPGVNFPRYRARRYSFEVEVLIRCRWAGIPLRQLKVEVLYPADRISHFSKLHDNLRTGILFFRLVTRGLIPWPHKQWRKQHWTFRSLLTTNSTPAGLGVAAGVGAAMGVSPIFGLQTLVLTWTCWAFRLNFPMAFIVSNISLGPLVAVWAALAVSIGNGILIGDFAPLELYYQLREQFAAASDSKEHWAVLRPLIDDWLVGSLVLMPLTGIFFGGITYFLSLFLRRRLHRRRQRLDHGA